VCQQALNTCANVYLFLCVLTVLKSVATAEVTNITMKVTMISMIKACESVPEGVIIPKWSIGCSSVFRANEAAMDPVNAAA
ncbi:hypothetical protein Tco_1177168, partial [Tanacetum coccineum]